MPLNKETKKNHYQLKEKQENMNEKKKDWWSSHA